MNPIKFVKLFLAFIALAILAACASGTVPVSRTDPSVQAVPYASQAAVHPSKSSCAKPDSSWDEGEKWAQKADVKVPDSTTTGYVERRFRAEKGPQPSYHYDAQGNCFYNADSYARSVRKDAK